MLHRIGGGKPAKGCGRGWGLASRNSARLALASDLSASVLADLIGTSISNATRWAGYARRDWLDFIASCTQI
ncbi:hypothetical protein [Streptomyces sp. NPDC002386]